MFNNLRFVKGLNEDEGSLFTPRNLDSRHEGRLEAARKILDNTEVYEGNLEFEDIPLTDLGKLKIVKNGRLWLANTKIKSLGNLERVEGSLDLFNTPIEDLGSLNYVLGHIELHKTPNLKWEKIPKKLRSQVVGKKRPRDLFDSSQSITGEDEESLFKPRNIDQRHIDRKQQLKKILDTTKIYKGDLDLSASDITSLGKLEVVLGTLILDENPIESLGNLERVEGDLDVENADIKDWSKLRIVTGEIYPRFKWVQFLNYWLANVYKKADFKVTTIDGRTDENRTDINIHFNNGDSLQSDYQTFADINKGGRLQQHFLEQDLQSYWGSTGNVVLDLLMFYNDHKNQQVKESKVSSFETLKFIKEDEESSLFIPRGVKERHSERVNKILQSFEQAPDWKGTLDLMNLPMGTLGKLKRVTGDLYLNKSILNDLGDLEVVEGFLMLSDSTLKTIGPKLNLVGQTLDISNSQIESLGSLEFVGVSLVAKNTPLKTLGKLKDVGRDLKLHDTPNLKWFDIPKQLQSKTAGKQHERVYEEAVVKWEQAFKSTSYDGDVYLTVPSYLHKTPQQQLPFTNLGKLKKITGNLNLRDNTVITDLGNVEEIGGDLDLRNSKVISLSKLKKVTGWLWANNSQLESLGNLEEVGNLFLKDSKVKDLGKLKKANAIFLGNAPLKRSEIPMPLRLKISEGKSLVKEGQYLGSCVDVGTSSKEVCKYFPDATTLSRFVGNPDEGDYGKTVKITKEQFERFVKVSSVPGKALVGKYSFWYVGRDNFDKPIKITEAKIFLIYNQNQDIHYFFKINDKLVKETDSLFTPRHVDTRHEQRLEQVYKLLDIEEYKGDLDLLNLPITHLGKLKRVTGDLNLYNTKITSLGNLEFVGRGLDLNNTKITSLGNLKSVGRYLFLNNTKITSLGNLKTVGDALQLSNTPITSLSNLEFVGNLLLSNTPRLKWKDIPEHLRDKVIGKKPVKESLLGNLKFIKENEDSSLFKPRNLDSRHEQRIKELISGLKKSNGIWNSDLDLRNVKIESLDELIEVVGHLYVNVATRSLKNLKRVYGDLTATRSKLENLDKLEQVDGNLLLDYSKIKALPRLIIVRGDLDVSYTPITYIDKAVNVHGEISAYEALNIDRSMLPKFNPRVDTISRTTDLRKGDVVSFLEPFENRLRTADVVGNSYYDEGRKTYVVSVRTKHRDKPKFDTIQLRWNPEIKRWVFEI